MVAEAYDVVIIGAGPSGIGAAAILAEYSLKVLLIDENNQIGGQIWRKPVYEPLSRFKGLQTPGLHMDLSAAAGANKNNRLFTTPAACWGCFPKNIFCFQPPKKA